MQINLDNMPENGQLTMAELETSKKRNRRGITRLSEAQIRRLEAEDRFPRSRKIEGTRCRFYVVKEIRDWLAKNAELPEQTTKQEQGEV